jgi:hypothetical protein
MVELPAVRGSSSLKPEEAPSGFSFCLFGIICKISVKDSIGFFKKPSPNSASDAMKYIRREDPFR